MRVILLILIGLSFLKAEFIRDNANNIVTDTSTGLQWQDDANVTSATKNWQEAINYCENLTLGGHSDWHLSNKNELQSIKNSNKSAPAVSSEFQHTNGSDYWSSTTIASDISIAWVVYFNDGYGGWDDKTSDYFVRCVRKPR